MTILYWCVFNIVLSGLGVFVFSDIRKACDGVCFCHWIEQDCSVHCVSEGLTQFPGNLIFPHNTTSLDISYNSVNSINVDSLSSTFYPNLKRLDATYCNISDIHSDAADFAPNLEYLELSHNELCEIANTFRGFNHLKSLSLSHNKISVLSKYSFSGLKLEQLDLQNNIFSVIEKDSFVNSNLNTLSLDWCPITEVNKYAFQPLSTSLKNLFWSHNIIRFNFTKDLFNGLHLEYLKLTHNMIDNIQFLNADISAKVVDLSYNALHDVSLCYFRNSATVLLSHCNIQTLDSCADSTAVENTATEELDLSFNDIKVLKPNVFKELTNLQVLNLANNKITVLDSAIWNSRLSLIDITELPLVCDCRSSWIQNLVKNNTLLVTGFQCLHEHTLHSGLFTCVSPVNVTLSLTSVSYHNRTYFDLVCSASGIPAPVLQWKCLQTDNKTINLPSGPRTGEVYNSSCEASESISTIRLSPNESIKCGTITCIAKNIKGNQSINFTHITTETLDNSETSQNIKNWNTSKKTVWLPTVLIVLVVIINGSVFLVCLCKFKKLHLFCRKVVSKWKERGDKGDDRSQLRLIVTEST